MTEYKIITQKYTQCIDQKEQVISAKKIEEDKIVIYTWNISKKEKQLKIEELAHVLCEVVQEIIIKKIVNRYLKNCLELTKEEKKYLKALFVTNNYLTKEEGVCYISYYLVYIPLLNMLQIDKEVNIDGWIQFRTKKYQAILTDLLEQTIIDYKTQKEYLECIHLLLESRNLEFRGEECLHLMPTEEGYPRILNEQREDVTKEYIKTYCEDLLEEEITLEDLVMDVCISACPGKIYIHQKNKFANQCFVKTLKTVFGEQIVYCEGCKYCKKE